MCLTTNNTRKYIAEKDIICYKTVKIQGTQLISYWCNFKYELNKKYKIQALQPISVGNGDIRICEGFHSYIKLDTAENDLLYGILYPVVEVVVKCIVPKGSEYYINSEEMVSNQIIIVEIYA